MATNPLTQAIHGTVESGPVHPEPAQGAQTALLDALIAHALGQVQGTPELANAPQLQGTNLPDPSPNSGPPIYGEAPGEGYLFARAPQVRQAALVHTDVSFVRAALLHAMETAAFNSLVAYGQETAQHLADAALKFAQAYLLIDERVDAEGVPVAQKIALQAATQQAGAPTPAPAGEGAHGTVKRGNPVGAYQPPPRVLPGAAAQTEAAMHEHAQEALQDARPSRPLPRPRPGA